MTKGRIIRDRPMYLEEIVEDPANPYKHFMKRIRGTSLQYSWLLQKLPQLQDALPASENPLEYMDRWISNKLEEGTH